MNQTVSTDFERDCDAALAWIARFRADDASEQDHRDFALWLAAKPGHRQAMDLMLELWDDLGSVRHLPFDEAPAAPRSGRRHWLAAAGALAASLLFAAVFLPLGDEVAHSQQFATELGQRETVTLPDQSRMTLNTGTRVEIAYSKSARQVRLLGGEAHFDVQADPARPFRVDTGTADVTAVGTAFNIHRRGDASDITVTEGKVRVTERKPAGGAARSVMLQASEQLQASRQGLGSSRQVDTSAITAWQRGELVAEELPLAELVRELARYSDTRILISGREVAQLTVSGVFDLDHPATILPALERSLGLEAVQLDDNTVRLLKAPR